MAANIIEVGGSPADHTGDGSGSRNRYSREQLADAIEKYRLLVELKRSGPSQGGGGAEPPDEAYWTARRDAMRALAARYPCSLREWDTQRLAELEGRLAVITELANGDHVAPTASAISPSSGSSLASIGNSEAVPLWLAATCELHLLLRELQRLRRAWATHQDDLTGPSAPSSTPRNARFRLWYATLSKPYWSVELLTDEWIDVVLVPPKGRLSEVAFRMAAERCGSSVEAVKEALFGTADD